MRNILVIPDTHHPYADIRAVRLAEKVAKVVKPDIIVFLGDWLDAHSLNFYAKNPARHNLLKHEVDVAAKELKRFRGLSDALVFCEGNHCERLQRYVSLKAPELYGLVQMHELLGLASAEWKPYRTVHRIGKCAFSHDFGYSGANAAAQSLQAYGSNCVFGHTHRGAVVYDGTIREERRFACNSGWLGDAKHIDYLHAAQTRSWQLGVSLITQNAAGESWVNFIPFVRYACIVNGKQVTL